MSAHPRSRNALGHGASRAVAGLVLLMTLPSCQKSGTVAVARAPSKVDAPAPSKTGPTPADASADPLGPKPEVKGAPAFVPPSPEVFEGPHGMRVWLLERHALPLVSMMVAVPFGAASDPKGKLGLAHMTANMLLEGAGSRDSMAFANAMEVLGASIDTRASYDASFAELFVLKANLAPALALFSDALARPRFEAKEFQRTRDLWVNDLKTRASEPGQVMGVLVRASLFGRDTPYGHPTDGFVATASSVTLPDVKAFYKDAWRPDHATMVVVGDVTRDELRAQLTTAFGSWAPPPGPPKSTPIPAPPATPGPRFVLVDRPDATQSVIAMAKRGVQGAAAEFAPLRRANAALGGSFTSRLNQDLREEHGWSYGARSRVKFARGTGTVEASASVVTEKTGDALKALLNDVEVFAREGLTDAEVEKTRAQMRVELVQEFESIQAIAGHLAANVSLGLGPNHLAEAARRTDEASKADLAKMAKEHFDPSSATVIVVGPKAKVQPQLNVVNLPPPEFKDPEGNDVKGSKK